MTKSEVKFIEALKRSGLSNSICESVNEIRRAIFEGDESNTSPTNKVDIVIKTIAKHRMNHLVYHCGLIDESKDSSSKGEYIFRKDGIEIKFYPQEGEHISACYIVGGLDEQQMKSLTDWHINVNNTIHKAFKDALQNSGID